MRAIERITSVDDVRVGPYLNIRESDLVTDQGRFIVEGPLTFETAVRASPYPLESVFLLDRRLEAMSKILDRLPLDVPVYVASQAVMDEVAGYHVHRGVLAVGARDGGRHSQAVMAKLDQMHLLVVLENLSNHDNVGGVFRNVRAFGGDAVLLDERTADPLYRKSIRVSIGSALVVPFARAHAGNAIRETEPRLSIARRRGVEATNLEATNLEATNLEATNLEASRAPGAPSFESMLDQIAEAGFELWAFTPHPPSVSLAEVVVKGPRPQKVALLFGAEGEGLTASTLARAHRRVMVPMANGVDSINVAASSAVALFACAQVASLASA